MTPETFRRLLDAYGADVLRWPPDTIAPAQTLLAVSAAARTVWSAVGDLDDLLAAAPPAITPDRLRRLHRTTVAAVARSEAARAAVPPRIGAGLIAALGRAGGRETWRLAGAVGVLMLVLGWAAAGSVTTSDDTTARSDIGTLLAEAQLPFDGTTP
jgi:hypothetical protein